MIESTISQSGSTAPQRAPSIDLNDCHAESRYDPIAGQWTIFAPHRSGRPDEFFTSGDEVRNDLPCPFCCGNEEATLPAVWEGKIVESEHHINVTGGTDLDWSVRVVPNLYPAVKTGPITPQKVDASSLFSSAAVLGGHEVFIESRQHIQSFSQLDVAEVQLTFLAFRDRIRHWGSTPGISYISLFKNVGHRAGASLRHSHSQLLAMNQIPPAVQASFQRMVRHRAETGCCLHCDLIRGEQEAADRIVWQDEALIAFCPFASHLPMLLRLTTLQHQARFEDLDEATIESVSRLVHRAVSWLESIRPGTAYNLTLSTEPPACGDPSGSFHWTIDLFPRMTQLAGFEWSSGCHINPELPETTAAAYRKCVQAENPRG